MENEYNKWNKLKIDLSVKFGPDFNERDIWWSSVGYNLGEESNGKNNLFERPVLVLKKLSKYTFIGVPFTTTVLSGSYYHSYSYIDVFGVTQNTVAMLHQTKVMSRKRLLRKIERVGFGTYDAILSKYTNLFSQIERPPFGGQSRTTIVEDGNSIASGENLSIEQEFIFDDFIEAMNFVNKVAKIAEEMQHHPEININYNKVKIKSFTHDAGNIVTEKDRVLMKKIDDIINKEK